MKIVAFFVFLITSIAFVSAAEDCTVVIKNGTIVGTITDTVNLSRKVCSYKSVPYASPPVGPLRFKASQPAQAWGNTTLNATSEPKWCPQAGTAPPGIAISEDCLYLNVHTPLRSDNSSTGSLPVMIWFHGGSFTSGSAITYTPAKLLARGDIVLVVVHYRLGLLGFLSTADENSPGNYGLKDQSHSIRWVNENIGAFGGNSSQVTIFGESAGGSSVIYQLVSPLNKDLIHGVIAQSGTALVQWAIDRHPLDRAGVTQLLR